MDNSEARQIADIMQQAMAQFQTTMEQRSALIARAEQRSRNIIYAILVFALGLNIILFYVVYTLSGQFDNTIRSSGEEISSQFQSLSTHLKQQYEQQILQKIQEYYILVNKNANLLNNTLEHVETITATFAANAEFMDSGLKDSAKTMQNIEEVTRNLVPMLAELNKSLVAIEKMTTTLVATANVVQRSTNDVVGTLTTNQEHIQRITQITAQAAEGVAVEVTKIGRDVRHFTGDALPRINTLVIELNSLSAALRQLTQELQTNPNMLLFGKSNPPGPGER